MSFAAAEISPDSAAMRSSVMAPTRRNAPSQVRRNNQRPAIIKSEGPLRARWESEYERIHAWAKHAFNANGFGD